MRHYPEARILVVDDEPDVLEAYQQVFKAILASPVDEMAALAADLFEQEAPFKAVRTSVAAVDLCRQGEEALRHIENKHREGSRYPVAFIDMRMPPGIDGLETAKRLRQLSPDISIVVVTGYSDHPPHQIASEVGCTDRFFYLVKPFNPDELLQLTVTLVNRWGSDSDAAQLLATKLAELKLANAALLESKSEAKQLEEQVNALRHNTAVSAIEDIALDKAAPLRLLHKVPTDKPADNALRAAFQAGHAAFINPHGLGLCPYSAVNEPELFAAFIAGYRSRQDQ